MLKAKKLKVTSNSPINRLLTRLALVGTTTIGLAYLGISPGAAQSFNTRTIIGCTYQGITPRPVSITTVGWSGFAFWDKAESYSYLWKWSGSAWIRRVSAYDSRTGTSGTFETLAPLNANEAGRWTGTGSSKVGSTAWRGTESGSVNCS